MSLAEVAEVAYAEPNLINRFRQQYTPQDTYFARQWHLRSWEAPDLVPGADVSATEAWDVTKGSREVVVAVIDDGFDLAHPDFRGAGKVVHPKDYVDGDARPFPTSAEGDYHGTPCAGVAIAEENGQGVVGVAPGCSFMPVRFPLSADDDQVWEIFDFVGQRADVISCSWGPPPVYAPLGLLLTEKFHQIATTGGKREKGCLICFAAGNYNAPVNDPANRSFWWRHPRLGLRETRGPILNDYAAHPDVIAVAASTSLSRKATYSNWGREISVAAPSNNFHPLDRYEHVPGRGIWTTDNEQFGGGFTSGSRFTGEFGGTSSATPLVAGVAALVISANPELTAPEVREILQETADKIEDRTPDPILGHRKGSYDNGHSEWFGHGKVNAANAAGAAAKKPGGGRPHDGDTLLLTAEARGNLPDRGTYQDFKVVVGKKLVVKLEGPDKGDFDLYVKKGSQATEDNYDDRGYGETAKEEVTLDSVESGEYSIRVKSYFGGGDYTLNVQLVAEEE